MSPDYAEEEGTCRAHNSNVWEEPGAVVAREGVDDFEEERMVWDAAHDIVGDTSRNSAANPGAIGEEWVETTLAALRSRLALL